MEQTVSKTYSLTSKKKGLTESNLSKEYDLHRAYSLLLNFTP